MSLLRFTAVFLLIALYSTAEDYWTEREFFEKTCLSCHEMRDYLWPRSFKSWELTIANMRDYIGDESILDEDGGRRIANFLTMYTGEGELIVPDGLEREPAETMDSDSPGSASSESSVEKVVEQSTVASETLPVEELVASIEKTTVPESVAEAQPSVEPMAAAEVETVAPVAITPRLYMPLLKRIWNPGRAALKVARLSGFLAVAALLGLLISGFWRRKLSKKFRGIHKNLAWILFVSLAVHGVIYIFEYGTPHVLWYWFGFVGLILLIGVQLQGKLRRRFRLGPLSFHVAGACTGLTLSILHWIWAWL